MTLVWNLFCVRILKCFSRIYAIFSGLRHSTKCNCLGDLIQSIQHVSESLGIWDPPQSSGRILWNGSCCSPIKGWRWKQRSPLRWLLWGHGGWGMARMTINACPEMPSPSMQQPIMSFYRLHLLLIEMIMVSLPITSPGPQWRKCNEENPNTTSQHVVWPEWVSPAL